MEKNQYLSPAVKVIDIRASHLLSPSEGTQVSGKSVSGNSQLSRKCNDWDEEDEWDNGDE